MNMLNGTCLIAAVALPGFALAGEAAPAPQSLAAMDAILRYCTQVMPAAADRYMEHARMLAQGASEEALAKVRASAEYRASHDAMLDSLAKVGAAEGEKACAEHLGPTR